MRLPRSAAGWTVAVFGGLALTMGALGLLWPAGLLGLMGLTVPTGRAPGDHTGAFLLASSMAAFNMGVYYLLAAVTDWRAFFRFSVVFRLVTVVVFVIAVVAEIAPGRFLGVAAWEGLGALATALGLRHDARAVTPAAAGGPVSSTPVTGAGR
ncbi:hypothetical protein O7606_21865 [Micromonospora sp. WMMD882]|uniref:hypothetical protein n=1 Tax=Micromonospora sp. WMMD882 TaxID=3015151 RepID=UPI00248C886B|nr:hypothetical protein [Micromonospora sp. WMMD882]WBB78823.1 hypothetical protein O7606_21865 [Micromonospora sp. WMMD882]